jgi:D-hexose-6-phosphate mutarotase
MKLDALKERFWDTPGVDVTAGRGGLPVMQLTGRGGRAEVYLHGAHVTSFVPEAGEPVLWMSEKSWFEAGKAIRGGIPICWPWFGPHESQETFPSHGVARLQTWEPASAGVDGEGLAFVDMRLAPTEFARPYWPHAFELSYRVSVGEALRVELTTHNTGEQPLTLTEALHSYFNVSDVREVSITGLEQTEFLDKVDDLRRKNQGDEAITFTGEVDRCYLNTMAACILDDPGLDRRIVVEKSGSQSTVVWNPHTAKAAAMEDYGDEEWPGTACIETANVHENAVTIPPGEEHTITAVHRVESRP